MPPRLKRLLFALVALALVALVVLALTEAAVRLLVDGRMDYTIEMWNYARHLKRRARDPLLGHEHVPGKSAHLMGVDVRINSHGLRDREIDYPKPPGTRRILVLGDSVAFGWGVPVDQTVAKLLEAKLNAVGPPAYEVINSGVGNYNSQMEVQYFLDEGYRYQPDQVIVLFTYNDAEETPVYAGNIFNENLESIVFLSARIDIVLRMLGVRKPSISYYVDLYRDDPPGWQKARAALLRLGEYCAARGIPVLIATHPLPDHMRDYPLKIVTNHLREVATAGKMQFIDLLPALINEPESRLWVTPADLHPNGYANQLEAQALFLRLHDGRTE